MNNVALFITLHLTPLDQKLVDYSLRNRSLKILQKSNRPGWVDDRPNKKILFHIWTFHETFPEKKLGWETFLGFF